MTTKTEKSRRTLRLPERAIAALREHMARQADQRLLGDLWQDRDLVFSSSVGTPLDAANVRRAFKKITNSAGLGDNWKPLELRTSSVSLMSHSGVPVEEIARPVGHTSTRTTEVVYRRELRPMTTTGAEVMDKIFSEYLLIDLWTACLRLIRPAMSTCWAGSCSGGRCSRDWWGRCSL